MEFFARLRLVWEPVSGGPLFNHTSAKLDLWAQFFTSYIMPATLPNDYSPDYLCASSVALSHWYQLHLLVHNATHISTDWTILQKNWASLSQLYSIIHAESMIKSIIWRDEFTCTFSSGKTPVANPLSGEILLLGCQETIS